MMMMAMEPLKRVIQMVFLMGMIMAMVSVTPARLAIPVLVMVAQIPPAYTVRNVAISLTGRLRDDNAVTQTITEQVRVRNDKFLSAIP